MNFSYNIKMKKGFTLIEILVVVLIIAIIAAIGIASYQRFTFRSYLAETELAAKTYIDAQVRYKMATGRYAAMEEYGDLDVVLESYNQNMTERGNPFGTVNLYHTGTHSIDNFFYAYFERNKIGIRVLVDQKKGTIERLGCFSWKPFSTNYVNLAADTSARTHACKAAGYTKYDGGGTCPPFGGDSCIYWKMI